MALWNTALLLLNINAAGAGGTCADDPGSPRFLDTGSGVVLVAVTSERPARRLRRTPSPAGPTPPFARAFPGQFVRPP